MSQNKLFGIAYITSSAGFQISFVCNSNTGCLPPPTEVAAVMAARLVWAVMLDISGFELGDARGRGGVMHWSRRRKGKEEQLQGPNVNR